MPENVRERTLARRKIETFGLPTLDSADHFFDLSSNTREIDGCAISAIAVRPAAINDKKRLGGVGTQVSLVDSSVRQIGCAWQVASLKGLRITDVQQYEVGILAVHGCMDIPTIRLETQ